jgi:cobalt-zinc-cadmium efflux system protein
MAGTADSQATAARANPAMLLALLLTGGFAAVEALTGWWANSLALISDAGHMAADAGALAIALLATRLAARPASERNSYGYGRAEIVGAFINGLTMLAIVVWIAVEAVARIFKPLPIAGGTVMLVAGLGLAVNLVVLWLLTRHSGHGHGHGHGHAHGGHGHDHGNLNTRAATVHVLGDLLGSVAAIVAGAVVHYTGWTLVDPLLSVLVALLILRSTWRVLAESTGVLMEAVPSGIDYTEVGRFLAGIEGVVSLHDLHVWQMNPSSRALSAHVLLTDVDAWPRVLALARQELRRRFGIDHVTLQPEWLPAHRSGKVIPLKQEGVAKPLASHDHGTHHDHGHGHPHDHPHEHRH